jgi:hypothetical protein
MMVFRRHEKERLLRTANVMALSGLASVGVAISGAVLLVASVVLRGLTVPVSAARHRRDVCGLLVGDPGVGPAPEHFTAVGGSRQWIGWRSIGVCRCLSRSRRAVPPGPLTTRPRGGLPAGPVALGLPRPQ